MDTIIKGLKTSRLIKLNLLLMLLGGLELMGLHLQTIFGPKVAAACLMLGAFANIVLRYLTTQPISEK